MALATTAAAACSPTLTDQTIPTVPYNPPINLQTFSATVTPGSGHALRDVWLQVGGMERPMTNLGGATFSLSAALPACDEVVPYRYRVTEVDASTAASVADTIFPQFGQYTRRIIDVPPGCRNQPSLGTHAFTVDTTDDLVDAVPGDHICSTTVKPSDPRSRCSVRAAVMEANASPGLDMIILRNQRYRLTLAGQEGQEQPDASVGDLDITESVVVEGNEGNGSCTPSVTTFLDARSTPRFNDLDNGLIATLDGGGVDRVLDIYGAPSDAPPVEVYLKCLHVTGGLTRNDELAVASVGGGGIENRATLLLDRVAVTHNTATGHSRGAGIDNRGTAILRETAVLQNQGNPEGDAFGGTDGGGLYNVGTAIIERSLFAFNQGARGPAIESAGDLTMINSTVSNHQATAAERLSAAIYQAPSPASGGPSLAAGLTNILRIYWSTIVEPRTTPIYSTLVGNLGNSIVYGSCPFGGAIASYGGNWMKEARCLARPTTSDVVSDRTIPPVRDELADYGGFTPTLRTRYYPDQPVTDAPVDRPAAALPPCPATDQRGYPRPADANGDGIVECDPGAFELRPGEPP